MKNILLIFLYLITITNTNADGGGDYEYARRLEVNTYESNLNLHYLSVTDTIFTQISKTRTNESYYTSNVAVYDITKDKTKYIFSDSSKFKIVGFYFESNYNSTFKTIEFNNEKYFENGESNTNNYAFSNNFNVSSRPISNNIIIITQSPNNENNDNLTIWICDKYGNNLKKVFDLKNDWTWEIDVKNQTIRISRQVNSKIEIKNEKY